MPSRQDEEIEAWELKDASQIFRQSLELFSTTGLKTERTAQTKITNARLSVPCTDGVGAMGYEKAVDKGAGESNIRIQDCTSQRPGICIHSSSQSSIATSGSTPQIFPPQAANALALTPLLDLFRIHFSIPARFLQRASIQPNGQVLKNDRII